MGKTIAAATAESRAFNNGLALMTQLAGGPSPPCPTCGGCGVAYPEKGVHLVYHHEDADGVLLYVGSTGTYRSRQRAHARDSAWWKYVANIKVFVSPSREAAFDRERSDLERLRPVFNRTQLADGTAASVGQEPMMDDLMRNYRATKKRQTAGRSVTL